jgi:hypothetical protein
MALKFRLSENISSQTQFIIDDFNIMTICSMFHNQDYLVSNYYDIFYDIHKISKQVFLNLHAILLWMPMAILYLNGPSYGYFGFWSGKKTADICSELTGIEAIFWLTNPVQCEERIFKSMEAWFVAVHFFIIVILLVYLIVALFLQHISKICFVEIKKILNVYNHQQNQHHTLDGKSKKKSI